MQVQCVRVLTLNKMEVGDPDRLLTVSCASSGESAAQSSSASIYADEAIIARVSRRSSARPLHSSNTFVRSSVVRVLKYD